MKLAVLGLGLIGGSIGLELKTSGWASEVMGVDENSEHAKQALALGLIDSVSSLEHASQWADLVVIATPVNAITQLLPRVLDSLASMAVVTDVGSTKAQLVQSVSAHARRKNYVASHPMAGTEFSGPAAAHAGLFRGKAAVICDANSSDSEAVQRVKRMYAALGMRLIEMSSAEHDLHAAYVSHLSHISSFVLANTVLDKEKDAEAIFNLASGGFESTVRLAKSSPEMWAPIFEQNQVLVTEALGEYIDRLKLFHADLVARDFNRTKKTMQKANEIKRVLLKIGQGGTRA